MEQEYAVIPAQAGIQLLDKTGLPLSRERRMGLWFPYAPSNRCKSSQPSCCSEKVAV